MNLLEAIMADLLDAIILLVSANRHKKNRFKQSVFFNVWNFDSFLSLALYRAKVCYAQKPMDGPSFSGRCHCPLLH